MWEKHIGAFMMGLLVKFWGPALWRVRIMVTRFGSFRPKKPKWSELNIPPKRLRSILTFSSSSLSSCWSCRSLLLCMLLLSSPLRFLSSPSSLLLLSLFSVCSSNGVKCPGQKAKSLFKGSFEPLYQMAFSAQASLMALSFGPSDIGGPH